MKRTAQRVPEIVLSRFSVYIRVQCAENNNETCHTHAKKYLHPFAFTFMLADDNFADNYADVLVEGTFRAIKCRLAQMNLFSALLSEF